MLTRKSQLAARAASGIPNERLRITAFHSPFYIINMLEVIYSDWYAYLIDI
jgi:hypothetical protein